MAKLGRLSIGSTKPIPIKSPTDDLLSSTDGGKHDYDWLLTPPETPLFLSSDTNDVQRPVAATRGRSVRSVSVSKTSKLSATHPENDHPTKPARSSSVTRPSISNTYSTHSSNSNRTAILNASTASVSNIYSTYSSNSNRTAFLNTSSASVSSSRVATPASRSTSTRVSASTARLVPARSSTPAKTRTLSTSAIDKSRPSHNPRPSTPTSRPQLAGSSNSTLNRSASRPSTPTRKKPAPPSTTAPPRSSSVGRVPPGRVTAPSSRPSSPSPRARMPPQPIVPPDFPLDAPPNLRTTLPDRPVSAGRSRPGAALTVRGSSEPAAAVNPPRRQPSPVVSRGRLPELSRRNQVHSNGHEAGPPEVQKPAVSRPGRSTSTSESTGFGRTISKKSLDMALKHMDIRQSVGNIRSMTSNSLYPHSIRRGNPKGRPGQVTDSPSSVGSNGSDHSNGNVAKSPDSNPQSNGENGRIIAKLILEPDIYDSSRYESILLKEDSNNTNWLHSVEDKSDQSLVFDHRFEPLPEPFGLI